MSRLYDAICAVLEAFAANLEADTLEHEFEAADWNSKGDG